MTKLRRPQSFEAALDKIRGDLTRAGMAAAVGKSESLVQQWTDPDIEAEPRVSQAAALDLAWMDENMGKPPIFSAYRAALSGGDDRAPVGNLKAADAELLDMLPALARVQAVVQKNAADGRWCAADDHEAQQARAELLKEVDEAIAAAKRDCNRLTVASAAE